MNADIERLAKERGMSPAWERRTEFVADLLPQGLSIVDIGCGAMSLERVAKPRMYQPIDKWQWDDRTLVIDLNKERLPADWLKGYDLASLLGVFEYVDDPRTILSAQADAGCAVVFTYHPMDLNPPDHVRREWRSHFTTAEFEKMLADAGFVIARRFNYSTKQRIYICHLADRAPPWLAEPTSYRSIADDPNPTLVVSGFFARGNCGDEALLQCVCEAMQADFDILISLDEHGAYQGYWDWYPYNVYPRTHQTNLGFLRWNKEYAGLLVGGGGLPYGFGANQAIHARAYQAATAIAGVDFSSMVTDPRLSGKAQQDAFIAAIRQYAELFDFRALRTETAVKAAADCGLDYFHGADWALKLPMDEDPSIDKNDRRVMVVLREVGLRFLGHGYVQEVTDLLSALEGRGFEPHFLPFAPEDERFLTQLGLDRRIPVVRTWWNPRRAKQWIASSGLTVSVGRLHPLVFAAPTGVRVCCVLAGKSNLVKKASTTSLETRNSKLANVCRELGISIFPAIEDAIAKLDTIGPADPDKVAQSTARLDAMTERLRQLFRESARSRAALLPG